MDLKQIAEKIGIPLPILMTGRKGQPRLQVIESRKPQVPEMNWPDGLEQPLDKPRREG
jgi:hypothetical protein